MRALGVMVCLLVSGGARALPSVALDLTSLDADSFAALDGVALEKSATVRLVQDGFAVVARTANPDVILSVSRGAQKLILTARGPGGETSTDVPWSNEPLVELHLELVQKLAELTRAVAEAKVVVAPPPKIEPPPVVEPPVAPRERKWRFSLAGGALWREGGVDPLGIIGARWGTRFRIVLEAGFSAGFFNQSRILEFQVSAGGAFALRLPASLELEVGALAGALVHDYFFWRVTFDGSGTRANMVLTLPVTLSWAPTEWFAFGLRGAAGWGQAREHVNGDQVLWTRGPVRLELGLEATLAL